MTSTSTTEEARRPLGDLSAGVPLESGHGVASAINTRIASRTAIVLTLEELCNAARSGSLPPQLDLVTIAFACAISGSAAMLVVPVAGRGVFTRAESIFLNGLRGYPGPAPNERLGVVDTMIFADERRSDRGVNYDGASLFLDLLRGERVDVDCHSVEGTRHGNSIVLDDAEFARFYIYNAALPIGAASLPTLHEALVPGTRLALNAAEGIVVGAGTRNRPDHMTLSITADMYGMDPRLMSAADGRLQHVIAFAVPALDPVFVSDLVEWTSSQARGSLLSPAALSAAATLQQSIRQGAFQLSETGPATRYVG